jgi:hypothetical protein
MKNRFTFSILSILVLCSLFISSSILAATGATVTPAQPSKQQVLPVANVNIKNAKLVSQKGNVFDISFDISNGTGLQTGVKYGVKLISKTKTGQVLSDEKVYDESLTLPENSNTSKEITYEAPSTLSGTYSILLFSSNTSGFPFGASFVKEVNLSESAKGLEIVTSSCYLKVEGDKSNVHYGLNQGVDIASTESLRLTCNTVNHTNDTLSLTPAYETRYHSSYGDIAPVTGGDMASIVFKAQKSESFSVVLPKGSIPQVYNVNVLLKNASASSNSINAKYLVRGASATIANLSLDKDYYKVGEKAIISLIWSSPSSSNLIRGGVADTSSVLSVNGNITNDKGNKCAEINQSLSKGSQAQIPAVIMSSCFNPHVSLSIKDSAGNTLDQKDFNILTTSSLPASATPANNFMLILIVVLIVIILIGAYVRAKKNKNMNTSSGITSN